MAKLFLDDGRGYTLTDTGIGYALSFHQTCEFWIDYDLRSVRVHLFADVHPDMAALFFVGNVIAWLLTLAGECVLHASAIEIGNSAIAFAGGSGMGKSTLAALLCANGARFITLQQGKHLQRRIDSFGRIAASIPIFKAEIPWGLPFPPDLAHSLARGVEAPTR